MGKAAKLWPPPATSLWWLMCWLRPARPGMPQPAQRRQPVASLASARARGEGPIHGRAPCPRGLHEGVPLDLQPLLGACVTPEREGLILPRLRIEKAHVAPRVNPEGLQRLATVHPVEEVVARPHLLANSEIERQHEVAHPDAIDR